MTPRNLLFFILFLSLKPAGAQQPFTLKVFDPRPLKEAIDELERRLGIPINYEDPRYSNLDEIVDITDQVQNAQQKARNPDVRIRVPRGGELSLDAPIALKNATVSDVVALLVQLRQAYEARGLAGRFAVNQNNLTPSLDPIASRDGIGQWNSYNAALNSRVTFPVARRNAYETLTLILEQVSKAIGVKVVVGGSSVLGLTNTELVLGANGESAKWVLVNLLDQISPPWGSQRKVVRFSYRMLYDPGVKYYVFSINSVPARDVVQPAVSNLPPSGQASPSPYFKKVP